MPGKYQSLSDFRPKSQEERDKEKEAQETREKLRKELEHELEECDKREYVKFALSHSKEPSEIRQHVRDNSISDDDASQKLLGLNRNLEYRRLLVTQIAKIDREANGATSYLVGLRRVSPSEIPRTEEGELQELANKVRQEADHVFNNRKGIDDDPTATPLTLFTKPRLERFVRTLTDDESKLRYLYKLQDAFMNKDERAFIRSGERRTFREGDGFSARLQSLISTHETTTKLQSESQSEGKNKQEKREMGGTQYQNLLAIHYLLWYARANNNNTKKAKFASFLTGYSQNTFRQDWSNIHRKVDESGAIWERDMKIVRDYFKDLGLSEVVKLIDNDLESQGENL